MRSRLLVRQHGAFGDACTSRHLVFPGFVAQGRPIEFLAVVLPQRHETIHVGNETLVAMTLEQMNHFMDNDVL